MEGDKRRGEKGRKEACGGGEAGIQRGHRDL